MVGWGFNGYGQATSPTGLSGVVAIDAGMWQSLALKSDGTVIGWGYNSDGQATPPAGLTGVVAIAAGYYSGMALKSDGTVVCWGNIASPPAGLSGVVAIAAGGYHGLALKSDGTVVAWGYNAYGQATPPAGLTGVVGIDAGIDHSLALKSDGTVVAWGWNVYNQSTPPAGLTNVAGIAGGGWHNLALTSVCPPNAPSALTATPVSSSQINLSWTDNANNEDGFKIERSTDGTNFTQIATVTTNVTAYSNTGLSPNTTYWYRVRAYNAGGDSPYSNQASATTLQTPPAAPSDLTVTAASPSQLNLSWTDNANNEDGFKIERSMDGTNFIQVAQVLPNTTGYRDHGVWPGTTYYYRVHAYNLAGDSSFSNLAKALTSALCANSVVGWGQNGNGAATPPAGLTGAITIAGGEGHSLALKSDGTVVCWGNNANGEATPPAGLSGVVAIAAGDGDSLALKSDGTVVGWGFNYYGETSPPAAATSVVAVAAGAYHSLALKSDGTVVGWGDDAAGEATPPTGLNGVVAIAACGLHSLALKSDGTVVGWGGNSSGQSKPPAGLSNVVAVAAGANHSVALKSDGTVVAWGDNSSGAATPPAGLSNVVAIAANDWHNLALKSDGTVVGWGDNGYGESTPPSGLSNVVAVAAGGWHSLVLTCISGPNAPSALTATVVSSSQINLSWIDNSPDEDGFKIERATSPSNTWMQIAQVLPNTTSYRSTGLWPGTTYYYRVRAYNSGGNSDFSNVASANTPVICLTAIVGWGDNLFGQRTPPAGMTGVVAIAANAWHSLALKSDGTVVGWGRNDLGQATPPSGLDGVVAIAAGGSHSLALKSDGTVVGWGNNASGQATPPAGLSGVVAIAAGGGHSLALKSDGTVVGWGFDGYGQVPPPAGLNGVVAIAGGVAHSLALKSDGTVVAWGGNPPGQVTPPAGLTGVVAIAAGNFHNLALKSDGTVVGWGYNGNGGATPPTGLTGVVAIAAGSEHSLALKGDGTVVGWGDNSNGQRTPPAGLSGAVAIAAAYQHSLALTWACPPNAPSALTATAVSPSQINLSWTDNANNEAGFKIERAPDSGGSPGAWTQIATVGANVTSYTDSGRTPNTTYWYSVRAYNAIGNSPYSNQASATIPLPPAAPSGLTAIAMSASEIDLSWTDNANNDDGFKIERSADGTNFTQIAQVLPNTTVYRSTGLFPNTTYYYRVRAYNAGGDSDFSNVASAGTLARCPTSVVGWGDNSYGQTTPPSGVSNVMAIAAGAWHGLALKSDGTVVGWGLNNYGQTNPPAGLAEVVAIAAGRYHSLALKSDGTVVGWGLNNYGQTNPPAGLAGVVAIAAGNYYSLALKSDGTVVHWGYNNYGQAIPPAGLRGVIAIAAGGFGHSLALKSDGTVVGWSYNNYGQATPPAGLTGVVAIVAGGYHSLALKSGGTVVAWGDNSEGAATPPSGLSNVVAIAAGIYHSLAVKSDGTLVGWGSNGYGEAMPPAGLSNVVAIAAGEGYSLALACIPTPNAPSALTATAVSASEIDLSWTDNADNEDGFLIERAPDNGGSPGTWTQIATVGANVTTYSNAGLSANTKYWYRLRAYNAGGDSDYSNQASGTTLQAPPAAPSGLTATVVSTNQINLSWTDKSNDEDGFRIERAISSGGPWSEISSVSSNVTAYSDTGVTCGQTYFYRVGAYNAAGDSPYSNTASANTSTVDTDGDGIPDCWMLQYFGHPTGQASDNSRPQDDADGDGQDNLTEFLAGMDPTNNISYWRIQASPTNGLVPLTVSFTDNSTGSSITNRLWNFGDGGVSSGTNPSHTYTNVGTFSVGLIISNVYGTETLVASNLITVSSVAIWTNANVSGNWSEATNWDPVGIPDHGNSVIFGTAGVTAMVDNVSRTVGHIAFYRSADFFVTASGGANLTITNGITVASNVASDFTYTVSAPVLLGGTNTWAVTGNGTLQVSGPISGANPITKTGSGTLILSGTNSYSGGTTVSNGTLKVTGTGLITNTASIDIASGATLDVSGRTGGSMTLVSGQTLKGGGTVQGNLILADGSSLSPGSSVGTLTFLNDLVVSNAAVLEYELGTNSDLTAVSSNLTLGGTLNINDAGGFSAGVYTLVTCGGTLAYNGLTIGTAPTNYNYMYTIDTNTAGQVKLNVALAPTTIDIGAANLQDGSGEPAPTSSVAVLVVDTGNNGFVDPQPGFPLSLGATWGTDDKIVGLWDLRDSVDCLGQLGGVLCGETVVSYTNGIAPGQELQLYWFPSLTLSSNTLGITFYGKYTDQVGIDGGDAWKMPGGGGTLTLLFLTAYWGGSNPETAGQAALLTAEPLAAGFSASPTNGVAPLAVTFTDTSTGTITNRHWDFGDSSTLDTTATNLVRTYAAGTYTVTLVVSGPGGDRTNTRPNYIRVLTPFQSWQQQYFGCTTCLQAAADADPDGDGQNNLTEFLAGTDPTNSMSGLRIIGVTQEGDNVRVAWTTAGGRTNAVQATAGDVEVGYTTNFIDISGPIIILGNGDTTTNYVDVGGATNAPARYYRIRLVP
ncbi:MAG: fibronectin type III domain-containing protein [Verrucomicrobiia bacterium]